MVSEDFNNKQNLAENSTVLIVDDIPENLQVLGNVLMAHGLDIGFAVDGMQALEAVEYNKPDLILLDIMMPGMDGFEVCKRLKSSNETKDIPIIFLTAKTQTEDIVTAFDTGAVDYVTKPFNANELVARVFTHLEIKKSRDIIHRQNIELNELNASKDKFFSIISHDLKGPYTGLLGLTNMIIQEKGQISNEEIFDLVQKVNQSLKNQYSLIENLLQWARIQTNRMEVHKEKFDLKQLVYEVSSILKNNSEAKNIKVISEVKNKSNCLADRFMMQSVIHNLLTNAIKFSPNDSDIIIMAIDMGEYYNLKIKDFGVGIKKDNLEKLFKIDTHISTLGTNNEKGTGLGLILVKEMVERNGGEIKVESEINKGTAFSITINKFIDAVEG